MTKEQFLGAVRERLRGLPQSDIHRSLDYYAEMIDDRMDDGLSEAEAVAAMGTPEYVASQILMDTPLPKLVKAKAKPSQGWKGWQIALLVLCAPVWLPLLLAAAIVIFSVLIAVWAVIFSLFITVFALGIAGIGCTVGGIAGLILSAEKGIMLVLTAAGLLLVGISILLLLAFIQTAKGIVWLCKWTLRQVKSLFIRKEENK